MKFVDLLHHPILNTPNAGKDLDPIV